MKIHRSAVYRLSIFYLCLLISGLSTAQTNAKGRADRDVKIPKKEFRYLDAKIQMNYKSDKDNFKGNVKLRMRKDSLIWLSITGPLGIEGLRGIVKKDSVLLIDRINKYYSKSDFQRLGEIARLSVDFTMLQALLLGEIPLENQQGDLITSEEKYTILHQKKNYLQVQNYLNKKNRRLEKLSVKDTTNGNQVLLEYNGFKNIKGMLLPKKSTASITYIGKGEKTNATATISFLKVKILDDKISFPFKIPEGYKLKVY